MSNMRIAAALMALSVAALGASCAKKPAPNPTPPTTAAPRPSVAPVRVTDVTVGRSLAADKSIADQTDAFAPADTIYASVRTEGTAPSAIITARWTYEGGQLVDETSQTIASNGGPNHTEFNVSKPDGWPAGAYEVEILLNGAPVQKKAFRVN